MDIAVLVVFLLGLVPVAAVVLVVVLLVQSSRRPAPAPSEAAEAARRHGVTVNAIAWVVAVLASPVAIGGVALPFFLRTGGTGLYAGIISGVYPTALGLLFLAVHAVGERTWPRPTGTIRRAALSPRQDVAPRWLLLATWSWAGALAITLTVGGITATGGRSLHRITGAGSTSAASPYPGWFYGVPLLVATAVLLVATYGVLRLVARRPAVVDADPQYDAASRRLSGHRVLRGVQLVLALTLAGVLFLAGNAVRGVGLDGVGAAMTLLALGVTLAATALAAVPGTRAVSVGAPPADPRSAPAPALVRVASPPPPGPTTGPARSLP